MDVFKSFATDAKKELEGTWVNFGDAKVLVARLNNRKYTRALARQLEQHAAELSQKDSEGQVTDAADAVDQKIMADIVGETILLGWQNLSYKGQPLEYSVASAQMLCEHKEFRAAITRLASDFDNFRVTQEVAQEKNS